MGGAYHLRRNKFVIFTNENLSLILKFNIMPGGHPLDPGPPTLPTDDGNEEDSE